MNNKTRLTLDDRINLQAAIAKGTSLRDVCKLLKKNRTTIYRELTKYYILKEARHSCSHCSRLQFCRDNGVVFPSRLKLAQTSFLSYVRKLKNILMYVIRVL